ncbi:MAG: protein translocase subunit SecF [Clostridia bacterium]|nr:protein translocase subunit SecF [Clostridia bacterium]
MFKNPCAHKKVFFIISIVLIVVSILSMAIRGFNLGIDFTGGTTFTIDQLPAGFEYSDALEKDMEALVKKANPSADSQIQSLNDGVGVSIKTSVLTDAEQIALFDGIVAYFTGETVEAVTETASAPVEEAATDVVEEASTDAVTETAPEAPVVNTVAQAFADSIGINTVKGTTSGRLIADTFKAVLLAVVLMLIYISIRFDFKSGVCAVMALAHDVLLMFGFYALFQHTMNTSFVAAVLTIIGYSINATIVVFDRVRENNKLMRQESYDVKADKAITTSYTRTLFSSLTTLFTIGALYVLGVSSIREFALPIIVGIVCGAYSSLFVAPTFWAFWKDASDNAKKARK